MDTVTIQLKHANAKKLLKDLEDMDIIKLIDEPIENASIYTPLII